MYDFRDVGSFAVMLLVMPLFVVVFAIALLFVAPVFLTVELAHCLNRRLIRPEGT